MAGDAFSDSREQSDPERTADLPASDDKRAAPAAEKTPPSSRREAAAAERPASPKPDTSRLEDRAKDRPPDPLINTVMGKCQLIRRLGEGGMGTVYVGKHLTLDIEVAVKILPPALANRDRAFVDRFLREARTAARIHHPNICQVLDVDYDKGYYFIVMEYIDGETAGQRLRRKRMLPEREVVEIGLDVAAALEYARRKHIIHRDVKPENILISREGEVKIADLGLAKRIEAEGGSGLTMGDQVIGTPFYISPEQATNARQADHRSDLYSLGATLFHLATGRPPFEGTSAFTTMMKHLNEAAPELRAFRAELSLEMAGIIKRLLQKDPNARHQTAGQLILDLRPLYERMVPQAERDAALAGVATSVEDPGPSTAPAASLQVSNITAMGSMRTSAPAPPGRSGARHEVTPVGAITPSAHRVPPSGPQESMKPPTVSALSGDGSGMRSGLKPAPSSLRPPLDDPPARRRPSRGWLLMLLLPFINVLALLWAGTVAKKREWWYWGLGLLFFQTTFMLVAGSGGEAGGLGSLGFIITYVVGVVHGFRIRKEVEVRAVELAEIDDE